MQSDQSRTMTLSARKRLLTKLVACLALAMTPAGCDSPDDQSVDRVSVSGQVTLDGRPLKAGAIVFRGPLDQGDDAVVTAYGFVENGQYRIDADSGPVVGTAQVVFRSKPVDREQLEGEMDDAAQQRNSRAPSGMVVEIPEIYGEQSELRVELVRGDENRHDFQLQSRS